MSKVQDVAADLWGESPRGRLQAALAMSPAESAAVRKAVASTSPMKPWPYGMPTVVNPFLVVLGPSPGNSPDPGDAAFLERPPYEEPTVGRVHPGFLYEDRKGYWRKTRELSVGILRGFDPELGEEDCYALSGQMNLSVRASGTARVEPEYVRWVPRILVEELRPRIIILLGLLSLLNDKHDGTIREDFASSGSIQIDWERPELELPFRHYRQKRFLFRAWYVPRPDGRITTVVSWPNHPVRSPMTNVETWRASIREGAAYFAT